MTITDSDLVVVSFHYVYIWRDGAQIFACLSIAYISGAQYLLYLTRYEQFLEFPRKVVDAVWNVKVADNENENHPDVECEGCRNGEV